MKFHWLKLTSFKDQGAPRVGEGGGGWNLKFVDILTKCVDNLSWLNAVGKFRLFYHKKQNAEIHQYPVRQKSTFTADDGF